MQVCHISLESWSSELFNEVSYICLADHTVLHWTAENAQKSEMSCTGGAEVIYSQFE